MDIKYDFCGYATRNNIRCSDGRVIMRDAFKDCDGKIVPLVWNHQHNESANVLGHALLENRADGVYAYGTFNDTESGQNAKLLVNHKDITALSIYANQLKQNGGNVIHGAIREVSLVLAGANPEAFIESVISHGEESGEEAIIYHGEFIESLESTLSISHADEEETKMKEDNKQQEESTQEETEETVADILDSLNEKQKMVVFAMIGEALESDGSEYEDDEESDQGGDDEMKHNVFDNETDTEETVLSHADVELIIKDAKRCGSMKESVLAHSADYGIDGIEYLFPEDRNLNVPPEFISREMGWVQKVMGSVKHSPFSRVKSMFADITEDQARAKGYLKGNLKKDEVFSLLKRSTSPCTVYKKQKMDRDDIVDITDFDVIAWIKSEMRVMLDEEIARAILIGDGRLSSDDDKIDETRIRPIVNDSDLFVVRWGVDDGASEDDLAKNFIKCAIKARKDYKGSGQPTLFTTEDMLTNMLLLEDTQGYALYKTEAELATKLRVKEIVTVEVMEGFEDKDSKDVYGIIVNLNDYNVGADKGGAINMFDDFDIDYNQQKYLIETRCSGALVKPFSAIVLREHTANAKVSKDRDAAMAEFK